MPYCETCHQAAAFHELTAPLRAVVVIHGKDLPSAGRCLKCLAASERALREQSKQRGELTPAVVAYYMIEAARDLLRRAESVDFTGTLSKNEQPGKATELVEQVVHP